MIFIALPVNGQTPPTARQTETVWILHEELTDGEIGVPVIIGEKEQDILLTSPTIVSGVEKMLLADELLAAVLEDAGGAI